MIVHSVITLQGFPGGSEGKVSACNVGDLGSVPGSGRSPEEGNGNPLQWSCLENPRDAGAWWAAVYGVSQSRTRLKRLSSSSSAGDLGSVPGSGRSPGERNGYPFQYSCLENSMDRGAWWATVHGVTKSQADTVYTHCVMKRPQARWLQLTFPDPDTRTSPFTSGC